MTEKLTPFQRLVMTNSVFLGLLAFMLTPEEPPYNDASTLGWVIYFIGVFVSAIFAIRAWVEYAEHKRDQFRYQQFLLEVEEQATWDAASVYDWKEEERIEEEFQRLTAQANEDLNQQVKEVLDRLFGDDETDPFRDDKEPPTNKGDK